MAWASASSAISLPWAVATALWILLFFLAIVWARERRMAVQRRTTQRLYQLGEELTAGRTSGENLRLLQSVLPELLEVTEVRVYVVDRASKTLCRMEAGVSAEPVVTPILMDGSGTFREKTLELCFRNRSLISIPDTRRSPFFDLSSGPGTPRSAMFIPMFAQEDLLGVLEVSHAKQERSFSGDEQAVAQHVGNQLAISMKLLDQKSLREQALGAEKQDATCRLVIAAAEEIKEPLLAIAAHAQGALAAEAQRAAGALGRLLRYGRFHEEKKQPVDLVVLVRGMLELRKQAWADRGISIRGLLAAEPVMISARPGLMEQVLLSLLRHVEDAVAGSAERVATLRVSCLASMADLDISWPGPAPGDEEADWLAGSRQPADDLFSLAGCQDLIHSQGGQIRLAWDRSGHWRMEVELPLVQPALPGSAGTAGVRGRPSLPLTTLILEPEAASRQSLISALSDLGHRSVPVSSAEEAIELAGRMHFHVLFYSSLPGARWLECFEKTRGVVDAFVVLTQGHDPALSSALPPGEAHALAKPVQAGELERLLALVGARAARRWTLELRRMSMLHRALLVAALILVQFPLGGADREVLRSLPAQARRSLPDARGRPGVRPRRSRPSRRIAAGIPSPGCRGPARRCARRWPSPSSSSIPRSWRPRNSSSTGWRSGATGGKSSFPRNKVKARDALSGSWSSRSKASSTGSRPTRRWPTANMR